MPHHVVLGVGATLIFLQGEIKKANQAHDGPRQSKRFVQALLDG